jgi:hypothetical protein
VSFDDRRFFVNREMRRSGDAKLLGDVPDDFEVLVLGAEQNDLGVFVHSD